MKRMARIVVVVALLIGWVVRPVWCEEDTVRHWETLNEKTRAALNKGDYRQGIILAKEARSYAIEHFGLKHPLTLTAINNLAMLYQAQGYYNEAEPLLKQSLQVIEKALGEEHPAALHFTNNLAVLYQAQGRYSEAESLLKRTLQIREKVLGKEHPDTLTSIESLAGLYYFQLRYSEAESLFKIALQLRKKVSGKKNLGILFSMHNLASIYSAQGRYSEAEPLLQQTLQLREKMLGQENPNTLASMSNLASLYESQGRYREAESLYKQCLYLREKVLGKERPDTIEIQFNYIVLLIRTNRPETAMLLLQEAGHSLMSRSFQEIYSGSSEKVRRLCLRPIISAFQTIVLALADKYSKKEYKNFVAEFILQWKQFYADESSEQHKLLNLNNDPEAEKLRTELAAAQAKLSQASHQPEEKKNIPELIEKANQDETALLALARHLRTGLEVKDVTLDKVLAALPQNSGLIEYQQFMPVDFKTGKGGKPHLAALLLLADSKAKQRVIFRDLGLLAKISKLTNDLEGIRRNINEINKQLQENQQTKTVASILIEQLKILAQEAEEKNTEACRPLLLPFDEQIKNLKQIYIAPDGPLNLLSFASLRLPDGRFLAERQQINQLQTGRDLLADNSGVAAKGMVAIGGAKYGEPPAGQTESAPKLAASYQQRAARELAQGIPYLPESRREAQTIGEIFTSNTGEKPTVLIGEDASEYSLKHLKQPPRILHLSTHGFYLAQDEKSKLADEAPLLLSGLALANANSGLQGKLDQHGDDGLLYSLEVLGLNLHGTELVSLSACETGKGVLDYSEGVYGLVRAFRTAGAKNVLMTLTPVDDKPTRDFMETFYDKWLSSKNNISPAEALHQTRLQFIRDKKPTKDWAPFVLVGK